MANTPDVHAQLLIAEMVFTIAKKNAMIEALQEELARRPAAPGATPPAPPGEPVQP